MFKRSFILVTGLFLLVFASAFATQMYLTKDLPSSFDPGLSIDKAFKTSKVPLLIEFYSDACTTCKRVAPMIHDLQQEYGERLTLVMLDITDPDNQRVAQLFGVKDLPGVYVFDHHRMKKYQINPSDFESKGTLKQALDQVLSRLLLQVPGSAEAVPALSPANARS